MNRERLKQDLERHEGRRRYAYLDTVGYWTVGVGRCIDRRSGKGLHDSEMDLMLANDIDEVVIDLDNVFAWWRNLDEVRQRVLCNMTFNLGVTKLRLFHNFLGALKNGHYNDAAKEMLDSMWARQTNMRAIELAEMMRLGTS